MGSIRNGINKIRGSQVSKDVREKTITYILAAFGLVAGLAWNEAIRALIDNLFPFNKESVFVKFLYAIFVTLVIVVLAMYLVKLIEKKEENK